MTLIRLIRGFLSAIRGPVVHPSLTERLRDPISGRAFENDSDRRFQRDTMSDTHEYRTDIATRSHCGPDFGVPSRVEDRRERTALIGKPLQRAFTVEQFFRHSDGWNIQYQSHVGRQPTSHR